MLANFLSKSKPINFIILLGIFLFFYLIAIYFNFFIDSFHLDKLLKSSIFIFIFLGIFFFYNFITSKNNLTRDNLYALFLFLLFLIFYFPYLFEYKVLILLLLHILFLRKVYSLKSIKQVLKKLFDAGFWLGISFIIEPLFAVFLIFIYAGIFIHKKITIHTIFSPIIGFFTPLIIYFTYCFWFDKTDQFLQFINFTEIKSFLIYSENNTLWFLGFLLLLTLISFFIKSPKALSINNSFKKNWILVLLNFVLSLLFACLIPEKTGSEIVYLLFPISIIIANGLEEIKSKLVKNIVLISVLICVILNQFFL